MGKVLTAFTALSDSAVDAVVQPDGKIVVGGMAGFTWEPPHNPDYALVRYNADGSPDAGLGGDGKVTTTPACTAHTPKMSLCKLTAGSCSRASGSFATTVTGASIRASARAGDFGNWRPAPCSCNPTPRSSPSAARGDFEITRLHASGKADPGFGAGTVRTDFGRSTDDYATAAALQPDRKIVVARSSGVRGQPTNVAVARYLNTLPQCVVPNVRARDCEPPRGFVARGRCAVGRVTQATSRSVKKGRVIRQSRRPGLRLPVRSRVNLVVSKRTPSPRS